jgi:thiamine biosynthesis lipoprotein
MKRFLLAAALLLSGCAERGETARLEWVSMGTVAAVQFRGGDADLRKRVVREVRGIFAEIERLCSAHDAKSELSSLAGLLDEEVLRGASALVRACYEAAFKLRDQTGGRFDPRWKGKGTLDLGAIAKGYAVDLACEKAKESGLEALIDLGGNLRAVAGEWRTLIATSSETLVLTGGMACATSAEYFRGAHIRDARTGGRPDAAARSVTVVHPSSAMLADALSTVMFILGRERGGEFLRRHYPEAQAVWLP